MEALAEALRGHQVFPGHFLVLDRSRVDVGSEVTSIKRFRDDPEVARALEARDAAEVSLHRDAAAWCSSMGLRSSRVSPLEVVRAELPVHAEVHLSHLPRAWPQVLAATAWLLVVAWNVTASASMQVRIGSALVALLLAPLVVVVTSVRAAVTARHVILDGRVWPIDRLDTVHVRLAPTLGKRVAARMKVTLRSGETETLRVPNGVLRLVRPLRDAGVLVAVEAPWFF